MALSTVLENELMELSADSSLKLQLSQVDLASFWLLTASEYPSQVKSSQVKLSFIVIPLHVGTYSGTRCRASQDHGAT